MPITDEITLEERWYLWPDQMENVGLENSCIKSKSCKNQKRKICTEIWWLNFLYNESPQSPLQSENFGIIPSLCLYLVSSNQVTFIYLNWVGFIISVKLTFSKHSTICAILSSATECALRLQLNASKFWKQICSFFGKQWQWRKRNINAT